MTTKRAPRLDRRAFLGGLGGVGAAALLAACGATATPTTAPPSAAPTTPTSPPAPAPTTAAAAPSSAPSAAPSSATIAASARPATPSIAPTIAAAPADLKELFVGIPADTIVVRPPELVNVGSSTPVANIYETLTKIDSDFAVTPWLAERWELVEPTTWRFTLRKDVTFHDGTPLTAKDVVWTFDRLARMSGGSPLNATLGGTKAIDDYTVEFTPGVVNKKIPLQLPSPTYSIMKANSDPLAAPMGTGPFKFVEYRPGEQFRVERHAGYWDKAGAAKVRGITFKYIPDNNARVLALRAGDLDLAESLPREAIPQLRGDGRLGVVTSKIGSAQSLYVNATGAGEFALTNERVIRQAVARAIDREAIVKQIYEGNAEVGRTHVPPANLGPSQGRVQGPKYDPAGAQKLLEDAGWRAGSDGIRAKEGQRLVLTLVSGFPSAGIHKPVPEVLQGQLRKVGIDVKIAEVSSFQDTLVSGAGHLWLVTYSQRTGDPASLPRSFRTPAGGNAFPEYGRLFGTARADSVVGQVMATADTAKSQEQIADLMAYLIDEEAIIVPIVATSNATGIREGITGLEVHALSIAQRYNTITKL